MLELMLSRLRMQMSSAVRALLSCAAKGHAEAF